MKKFLTALAVMCFCFLNLQAQSMQLINTLDTTAVSQPLIESDVFNLINQKRVANLLKPLTWSSTPAYLARQHSLNMANGLVPFGHQGVNDRYNELRKKIASLTSFGENVAYNSGYSNPAQVAVNGWLASPGHYANIMGDYNLSGVGVAKNAKGEYYFTQIFAKANQNLLNSLEINQKQFNIEKQACIYDSPIQLENIE